MSEGYEVPFGEGGRMITPTEWSFDPLPSNATGWYAVIRCWDAAEGMFPSTAWAENGAFEADEPAVASDGSTGHAGPFPTEQAADQWGDDHDLGC